MQNVREPVKCLACEVGLHEECYYTFHEIKEGVVLDVTYDINVVRESHKSLKKWHRKWARYHLRRVQLDIHNGVEVPGNNSQDDRKKGEWEVSSDSEPQETKKDSC